MDKPNNLGINRIGVAIMIEALKEKPRTKKELVDLTGFQYITVDRWLNTFMQFNHARRIVVEEPLFVKLVNKVCTIKSPKYTWV
jgi:hypothetical protein